MVQKVRQSLRDVMWQEQRVVTRALRAISGASTLEDAKEAVEQFAQARDAHYPTIRTN